MPGYEGDLTPHEAWELLENHDDAVLVDVRTEQEWRETGIPDLAPIHRRVVLDPLQTFAGPNPRFVETLHEAGLEPGGDRPVVFVCRSGGRSAVAAAMATAAGLTPAYNVSEGIEGHHSAQAGWLGSALPVAPYTGEPSA